MVASTVDGWRSARLGELGTFTKGAPLSKNVIDDIGTPIITYGELYTTYAEVAYSFKNRTTSSAPDNCYSRNGDVIIPSSGETAEDIATATCVMADGVILAGDLNIYRSDSLDGRFLSYVINHVVNDDVSRVAQGSSIIHVNAKSLSNIEISFPDISEQKTIADTLSAFDQLISSLEELIEKKRNIREGVCADLANGVSKLDGSKVAFRTLPLSSIAQYVRETATCPKSLFVSTENMLQGFSGIEPYSCHYEVDGHSFREGDVLLGNIRPYLKKAWLADYSGCCSPDVLVIRPNEDINPHILYYCLANDVFIDYVISGGTKGTKMPRGDKKYIMQYQIAVPCNTNDQDEIANAITNLNVEIAVLEEERNKWIQIRDGAMDDLLTGRVRLMN